MLTTQTRAKNVRLQCGFSTQQVAAEANLSAASVRRVENGQRTSAAVREVVNAAVEALLRQHLDGSSCPLPGAQPASEPADQNVKSPMGDPRGDLTFAPPEPDSDELPSLATAHYDYPMPQPSRCGECPFARRGGTYCSAEHKLHTPSIRPNWRPTISCDDQLRRRHRYQAQLVALEQRDELDPLVSLARELGCSVEPYADRCDRVAFVLKERHDAVTHIKQSADGVWGYRDAATGAVGTPQQTPAAALWQWVNECSGRDPIGEQPILLGDAF